jgi:hypothetical protein
MSAAVVSKPLSYDNFEHRLFLTTNERGDQATFEKLAKESVEGNTLIAVSGFFGLDLASIKGTKSGSPKRIEHIIVLDRSPRVEHFWAEMKTIIKGTTQRDEVIKKILDLLERKKEIFFSGDEDETSSEVLKDQINDLQLTIKHGISWLSSDERFNRIKAIFDREAFTFIRMDLCDSQAATILAAEMKKINFTTDTLYLSNVYEYIVRIEDEQFHRTLMEGLFKSAALLMNPRTTVIHAPMHSHFCTDCDVLTQASSKPGPEKVGNYLSSLQVTCCACTATDSEKEDVEEELSDIDEEPPVDKLDILYQAAVAANDVQMKEG